MEEEFWTFNSIHPCLKDIRNFKLDFFSKLLGWRPLLHSAEMSVHLGKLLPILNYSDILSCRRLSRLIIFFKWHWESRFRVVSKIKKTWKIHGCFENNSPGLSNAIFRNFRFKYLKLTWNSISLSPIIFKVRAILIDI